MAERRAATNRRMASASARHWAPAGWQLLLAGALLALLWIVVLSGLGAVFELRTWLWRAVTISTVTVIVGCALRALRPSLRAAAAFGGLMSGGLCWAAWFGLSGRAERWWQDPVAMLFELWSRIDRGSAPLDPSGPLEDLVLLVVLLASGVSVLLLVGLGHPLAAGAFAAMLLLIPAGVTGFSAGWAPLLATGTLLALLAWLGSPSPGWAGLIAAGAAVAVAAGAVAIAPPTRDRVWNSAVMLGPLSSSVPDVTIALADDLREHSDTRAFTFTGGTGGPQRFSLATLSEFTGGRWMPQAEADPAGLTVDSPRTPSTVPPQAIPESENPQLAPITISIEGLLSSWLPLPQSTLQVTDRDGSGGFDPQQWMWTADASTARSDHAITRPGYTYRAEATPLLSDTLGSRFWLSAWDSNALGADPRFPESEVGDYVINGEDVIVRVDPSGTIEGPFDAAAWRLFPGGADAPPQLEPYLELPSGLPKEILSTAKRIAGSATDRLTLGIQLQQWLRGGFTYDESAPYEPGADPNDPYAVMTALLKQKRGFCVHFASTFAVMARALGAPARIAVGYAARSDGPGKETVVRGKDLHAWPEIYFDDAGWVAFEPTPGGAGVLADEGREVPATPTASPSTEPTRTSTPPPQRPTRSADRPDTDPATNPALAGRDRLDPGTVVLWSLPVLVTLLLLVPGAWRGLRRRRRLRAIARGDAPAQQAWAEFSDTVVDLGLLGGPSRTSEGAEPGAGASGAGAPRARTPEALVEHLEARSVLTGDAAAATRRLATELATERYGGGAVDAATSVELLRIARGRLLAQANRAGRFRAVWLPRSILQRTPRPR